MISLCNLKEHIALDLKLQNRISNVSYAWLKSWFNVFLRRGRRNFARSESELHRRNKHTCVLCHLLLPLRIGLWPLYRGSSLNRIDLDSNFHPERTASPLSFRMLDFCKRDSLFETAASHLVAFLVIPVPSMQSIW